MISLNTRSRNFPSKTGFWENNIFFRLTTASESQRDLKSFSDKSNLANFLSNRSGQSISVSLIFTSRLIFHVSIFLRFRIHPTQIFYWLKFKRHKNPRSARAVLLTKEGKKGKDTCEWKVQRINAILEWQPTKWRSVLKQLKTSLARAKWTCMCHWTAQRVATMRQCSSYRTFHVLENLTLTIPIARCAQK